MLIQETADIKSRIEIALQTMRPFLQSDGGDIELVEVTSENDVKIRLLGACSSCDMSHMTLKAGIEEGIKKAIPEVREVISVL